MTVENTLVFLKRDALACGVLSCRVIERVVNAGFRVVKSRLVDVTDNQILEHYDHLVQSHGEIMRRKILDYFSGSKVFVMLVEKENAVKAMRDLVGATDPKKADVGTVRGDLATDDLQVAMSEGRFVNNLIHASDSVESVAREEKIWLR